MGVRQPNKSKIFVLATPVGPYFPGGFKPIRLYANKDYVRAYEGGCGQYKIGS